MAGSHTRRQNGPNRPNPAGRFHISRGISRHIPGNFPGNAAVHPGFPGEFPGWPAKFPGCHFPGNFPGNLDDQPNFLAVGGFRRLGPCCLWMFSDYIRRRPRYNFFMVTVAKCLVCVLRSPNVVGGMEFPRYPLYVWEYGRRRADISGSGWASMRIGFFALSGIHLRV